MADAGKSLKVFRNTAMTAELALLARPTAMTHFYPSTAEPRLPSLAVAAGPHVYIYRQMRPFFKLTLPPLEVDAGEADVWRDMGEGKTAPAAGRDRLRTLRDGGARLTSQSADLLAARDEEVAAVAEEFGTAGGALRRLTVATCMERMCVQAEGDREASCLVIGTEAGELVVTDASGTKVVLTVTLPGVPAFLAVSGAFQVDYRIVAACRDGRVYSVKKGRVMGHVIELEAQPCGLAVVDRAVVVACTDQTLNSFHFKGRKNWSVYLPHPVMALEPLLLPRAAAAQGVLAALSTGEVRLYRGRHQVGAVQGGEGAVTAVRFGPYGREESSLVVITRSGALAVKMLSRHARLDSAAPVTPGPPPEQDVPLAVPKKTRLYLEQCQREREQPGEMHRAFQRDLAVLRLDMARSYVKTIADVMAPMQSGARGSSLRLDATVHGLGPRFKLRLRVRNAGEQAVTDVPVAVQFRRDLYRVTPAAFTLPALVPGRRYARDVDVERVAPGGGQAAAAEERELRVLILSGKSTVPAISAVVVMPPCETE